MRWKRQGAVWRRTSLRSPLPLTNASKDSLSSSMAYFLYNALLHIAAMLLLPYFLFKMATARKYREGIPERFGFVNKRKLRGLRKGKVVWVHAVSVGEKEIWPNAFRTMRALGAPVAVVNGTIADKSARGYMRLGFLFRDVFSRVNAFLARTEDDMEKAVSVGVPAEAAELTGNLKFALSPNLMDRHFVANLKEAIGVKPGSTLIVAGSTHPGEEEIVLAAYKTLSAEFAGLKLIIAPRHPERFNDVEGLLRKSGLPYARRSKGSSADVVLLDSIGELMTVYSLSDIAIVGGSLVPDIGGHNLLEPAYFGKPVIYGGPLTTFLGLAELREKKGGGVRVQGEKELGEALKGFLSDEVMKKRTGALARGVVEENRGASERTADALERLLG